MVNKELESDQAVLCVSFNGWLFEGYDDAKAALLETIITEISKKKNLSAKAKDKIKFLFGQINWMRVTLALGKYGSAYYLGGGGALTLSALPDIPDVAKKLAETVDGLDSSAVEDALKKIKEGNKSAQVNIREFHKQFAELIELSEIKKLVVFIDDLDRCNPDTIIETLEAIRLFLYAKDTVFILAADERLVKYAVTRKYPDIPGIQSDISRDYLEKLVQFPVTVTPLGRAEVETYMKLLFVSNASLNDEDFEKIREKALGKDPKDLFTVTLSMKDIENVIDSPSENLVENIALAELLASLLSVGLAGNPRQIKRFLNTIIFRQSMASGKDIKLETKILAKLMLLEYFKPDFFRKLAELQAVQDGKPTEIIILEEKISGGSATKDNKKTKASKESQKNNPEDEEESELINLWSSDPWIIDWINLEPKLQDVDLKPYFYFSRDILSPQKDFAGRLSPIAQEIIASLISTSEALNRSGIDKIQSISPGDAAMVFDTLTSRIRSIETQDEKNRLISILLDVVETRSELGSQLIGFLGDQPVGHIPIAIPPRITGVIKEPSLSDSLKDLLLKWKDNQSNSGLSQSAKMELEKTGR
jgi:predicted KAP-like P-loop ATPase